MNESISVKSDGVVSVTVMSIRDFTNMRRAGKINTDMAYQRGLVSSWTKQENINSFIDSILSGFSVQALHVIVGEDGSFELLDGKQRLNCIMNILDCAYINADGVVFGDWSDDDKQKFLAYPLVLIGLSLDDNDRRVQFERLAGGQPLSGVEKRRGSFINIMSLPVFKVCVGHLGSLDHKVAGKPVTAAYWENILLQAVAYTLDGFSGTLGGDLGKLFKTAALTDVTAALDVLAVWLAAFVADYSRVKDNFAWLVAKKTYFNAFLSAIMAGGALYNVDLAAAVGSWRYQKSIHEKIGADQQIMIDACASASGSKESYESRVKVMDNLINGKSTVNKVKASVIASGAGKVVVKYDLVADCVKLWGDKSPSADDVQKIITHCESVGWHDIKPRVESTGSCSVSFLDKEGKGRVTSLTDLIKIVLNPVAA